MSDVSGGGIVADREGDGSGQQQDPNAEPGIQQFDAPFFAGGIGGHARIVRPLKSSTAPGAKEQPLVGQITTEGTDVNRWMLLWSRGQIISFPLLNLARIFGKGDPP